jgi:hypothetical protein
MEFGRQYLERFSLSAKIKGMRNVSWPLAIMVSVAMVIIGVTVVTNKDVSAVTGAIVTILIALGLAELREIKSNTNGNQTTLMEQNRSLMAELAQYRRDAARFTDRAMDSQAMTPPTPPDGQLVPTNNDRL